MIQLRHVAKAYGSRLILRNITHTFKKKEVTLITGANGAGKSTLLKLICGLAKPTAGQILVCEEAFRTGYLGHTTFLYPALTALENLRFWQRSAGLSTDDTLLKKMLEHTGLSAQIHIRAGVFSRGMMQRLNLARLLLINPDLLLLDEPSTGLDTESRLLLEQEIIAARERGACVVWVSHDAAHDAPLADNVLTIKNRELFKEELADTQLLSKREELC